MANYVFHSNQVSGGADDCIDGIDPLDPIGDGSRILVVGDAVLLVTATRFDTYLLRDSAGAVESLPEIVIPDNSPGNLWWERVKFSDRRVEVFTELDVASSESRVITHSSDPENNRFLFFIADGEISSAIKAVFTSDTTTTITSLYGATVAEINIRIVL